MPLFLNAGGNIFERLAWVKENLDALTNIHLVDE